MVGEPPLLMKTSSLLRSCCSLPCKEPRQTSPKPQAFPSRWLYCPVAPDSAARAALRPFPAEMSSARLAVRHLLLSANPGKATLWAPKWWRFHPLGQQTKGLASASSWYFDRYESMPLHLAGNSWHELENQIGASPA